ncbi:TrbG/VirB9 family P-type conjugative transfer protein [Phenylobacterium sp.]|uniref:TrbG/VirB9 family P-type conjugative transfer protein n=1 Tax=Phenylobacterium sp. TaxID=1871053 RepID=UPI0025DC87D3|nr:TrbG/VirB9 family P-type conjugative transfer protein [Phenylobacterium sp.]MCA3721171.1 TrbG/VirB9 family P-type conjugative transfer protein [Phenylobacterium sp.]
MSRSILFALCLLLTASAAHAVTPRPGGGDPRVHFVDYDPLAVVELRGALRHQLTVEFDPAERIENVAIGDSLGWQVTPNRRANLLFLKPMARRPSTNMTVVTNLRRYTFNLTTMGQPTRSMPFTVRFLYAPPVVVAAAPPPPDPPPEVRNSAYVFQGSRALLPVRVFDDGRDTYFNFPVDEDLPAIFAVESDGQEALVNLRLRDGLFVADRIAQAFVLRRGGETTRLINEGFRRSEESRIPEKPRSFWRR